MHLMVFLHFLTLSALFGLGGFMKDEKRISLKVDPELYKKLKIKATVKDESVNEYIKALIIDDVANVDLSAIIGE